MRTDEHLDAPMRYGWERARSPILKFGDGRVGLCYLVLPRCYPVQVSAAFRAIWCCPVTSGDVLDVCNVFAGNPSQER